VNRVGRFNGVSMLSCLVLTTLVARWLDNPLLVPTFTATLEAFEDAITSGEIPQ
jgi:NitT/TauT family transport system permease protein